MNLRGILGILTKEERRSGTLIAILSAVCALLEAASIGAVFPLVSMLLDHAKLSQFADGLQRISAIPASLVSEKALIGAFAALLLVKNAVVILVTRYKSARIYDLQTRLSAELVREFMLDRLQMVRAISGGQKVSLAVTECQQLMLNTVTPCLTLIAEMATLFAVIIVLFVAAPLTTLALGVYFALVLGVFNLLTRRRVVGWGVARKEADRARQEIIKNVIESRPEIVGMGLVESVLGKYGPANAMSASASAHKSFMGEASKNMLEIGFLGSLGVLAVLAVNIERSEMMAIAVLFVGAAYRLMPSINRVLVGMHSWKFGIATLEMLLLFHRQREEWAREHPSAPEPIRDAGARAIESLSFACPTLTVGAGQVPVLAGVKLDFRRGELVAIVGASGSGKTTLVQAILDNEAFPGAETRLNGGPRLLPGSPFYERIAYVSQRPLIVNGTVRDNLYIGMEERGRSPSASFPSFLLDGQPGVLGGDPAAVLGNRVEISSISGGQAQRIALARAIVRDPDVLVLDEPTSALNESYRSQLIAHLRRVAPGAIVIMITHDRAIASACDRILEVGNLTIMEDTEKTR